MAQTFIDGYFAAFRTLAENFERAKQEVLELGYIEIDPITGRRWFWKDFKRINNLQREIFAKYPRGYSRLSKEKKEEAKKALYKEYPNLGEQWSEVYSAKGKVQRNALNYRIQGLAASQTKKAGILFREWQIRENLWDKIWLTNLIHDEFLAECLNSQKEKARVMVETCMKEGAQYFCKKVKMDAQAVIVNYWHH